MKFNFGKFEGIEIIDAIKIDRKYCEWILDQINNDSQRTELSEEIEKYLNEFPEEPSDPLIMQFGKYEGDEIEDFIFDKTYCLWLLEKSNLLAEYPNTYKILKKYYKLVHEEKLNKIAYFYYLVFKGESFLKVGISRDYMVKRIYNYGYGFNKYKNFEIDFKKSYVFKTNDSDIEKKVLKRFKKERIGRSESIKLAPKDIELFLKEETLLDPKNHYVKKQLFNFLPFGNHDEFKHEFILKINQFLDFEKRYLDYLEMKGLKDFYNPNFDDIRSFDN